MIRLILAVVMVGAIALPLAMLRPSDGLTRPSRPGVAHHSPEPSIITPSTLPSPPASTAPRRPRARASRSARAANRRRLVTVGGWRATLASWYDVRPGACYDERGRHPHPAGVRFWTAHRTLPCGTLVVVRGPAGRMQIPVLDRGPYVGGRDLDLSRAAFERVCGDVSRGVCGVRYRRAA